MFVELRHLEQTLRDIGYTQYGHSVWWYDPKIGDEKCYYMMDLFAKIMKCDIKELHLN